MKFRLLLVRIAWLSVALLARTSLAATAGAPVAGSLDDSALMRPFNQEDYSLAYEVFLGSGDPERAFLVAREAVRQRPMDGIWRRKLAQVADWSRHPEVAAQQWRALFLQGDRSEETVLAVIRLAALLEDQAVVLQAWGARANQTALGAEQWADIYELYESLSEPAQGSVFFEAQFHKTGDVTLLEYAARLAENAAQDDRAQALYAQRVALQPFSMDITLRAVVNLIRRDQLPQALAMMQAQERNVKDDAAEYWRLLANLAWDLNAYPTAQNAYEHFSRTAVAGNEDWLRLVFLVRQNHPQQAAALALQAYRRFGVVNQLVSALEIYGDMGDFAAQDRVIASLDALALTQAEQDTRFVLIRARLHQRNKHTQLAWQDIQRALHLSPGDSNVVLVSLWFLIDEQRRDELSAALSRYALRAAKDPAYWSAYAAANQVLERGREALHWYGKALRQDPQNLLLMLNYADALERVGRAGMAARVRRHAWLGLKEKFPQAVSLQTLDQNNELQAMLRLAMVNQSGDAALQWVRALVRPAPGSISVPTNGEQARVLVLGWALLKEQFANARSWMWSRYTRQSRLAPPLWADTQVALQLQETPVLDRLLSQQSAALPLYSRHDTAYALGHVQQALDLAFQGMTAQDDEILYDRYRQQVTQRASYVQTRLLRESLDALDSRLLQFETRLWPLPNVELRLAWSGTSFASDAPSIASLAEPTARRSSVQALWHGAGVDSSLELFQRAHWQDDLGMRWQYTQQRGGRLSAQLGLDVGTESTLSQPMRLAGYENAVYANLNYNLGKRESLRVSPRVSQYFTQFGDYLGSARSLDLEAAYRLRTEYPDWRLRAFVTHQRFYYDGAVGSQSLLGLPPVVQAAVADGSLDPLNYFLPQGSSSWGACVAMGDNLAGQNLQTSYSRAWRPFMDACLSHNTSVGDSYSAALGMAGSVTGEDHLLIQLQGSGGALTGGSATRALTIRYRHYF